MIAAEILVSALVVGLFAALTKLFVDEILGWASVLPLMIIRLATWRLPQADQRARYREEWEADIASLGNRRVSALLLALSIVFRARGLSGVLRSTLERSDATRPSSTSAGALRWSDLEPILYDPELREVDTELETVYRRFGGLLDRVAAEQAWEPLLRLYGPMGDQRSDANDRGVDFLLKMPHHGYLVGEVKTRATRR